MDVRAWCYAKAAQGNHCGRLNDHDHDSCVTHAFAPTITKFVEALREFDKAHSNACAAFPATSEAQVLRDCDCRVKQAREALDELEKP